jgi:putative SOS response-associated peptidase YedK
MDPNEPILRKQVARDYPDQTYGELVEPCTILTTQANEVMRSLHDRMPVIFAPSSDAVWLDSRSSSEALHSVFVPYPGAFMKACPIGDWGNNPKI